MTNISRSTDGAAAARRRAWTGLACASVLALTAGCAAVGPNFKAPAPPAATSYAMAGDDAASPGPTQAAVGDQVAGAWWSLFKSPALDQLVREAIANNRTLEQARARLAASHEAVRAESGLLTADFSGGIDHERANLNAFSGGAFSASSLSGFPTNPIYNLYTISPSISYNLDLFGAKRRRVESLKATAEAQARELDAAYLILSGEVFEQALTVADANLQIRALEGIGANDQADLDMLRRAEAAGGATAADIAAAESQLAADQAAIPVQRQRLAVARHALATLVGKTSAEWSPPEFDETSGVLPASLPVSLPSRLVRNRPDILEAEAELHAATADIGVAEAAFYPDITLSATIAQSALTPQTLFSGIADSWAVGGGLTTPIFHSGQLKARKREAEAQARAALAAYEETVLEAFNQVDDALQAVAHDNDAYARQSQAVAAAEARLEMMRKAQAAGGASAQDVIRAERDWRRLKLILSQQGTSRFADAGRLLLTTAAVPPKG